MKIFKAIIVLTVFAGLSFSCTAQKQTPKNIVETFFKSLKNGETAKAYDQLFVGSNIPTAKPQAVNMLKRQTGSSLPMYGKILGFELVSEEKFGSSVVRLVYLLKLEKHPIGWEFFFYKPKSKWFLANIRFHDQFSILAKMK